MKKYLSMILVLLLVFTSSITAKEKSVENISNSGSINNAGPCYQINYNGQPCKVVYGANGIDIVGSEVIHLDTNFAVSKLIVLDDINGDNYVDFMTYQLSPENTDQIFVVSGKDGSVIASTRLTRIGDDGNGNAATVNSYIYDMRYIDGQAILNYNYNILSLNPLDCSVNYEYENKDNIWDFVNDQENIYFVDQLGQFGWIDLYTGELKEIQTISSLYEVESYWDTTFEARVNLWDIYLEGNNIYITGDDGILYVYNLQTKETSIYHLNLIDVEIFKQTLTQNYSWVGDSVAYSPAGMSSSAFKRYKVIDSNTDYLLISCNLHDRECTSSESSVYLASGLSVFNKTTGDIANINLDNAYYLDAILSEYEGKPVVVTASQLEEKKVRFSYINHEGKVVYQKEANVDIAPDQQTDIDLSLDATGAYKLEIFNYGVCTVSKDLKTVTYLFDMITAELIGNSEDSVTILYKLNGQGRRIVNYKTDMKTINWEYEITGDNTHGTEFTASDDYNLDGINDSLIIYNTYNKDDEPIASNFLFLSGKDGKVLVNKKIFLYTTYNEKGKPIKVYQVSDSLKLIKDLDKDGKREILIDGNVISSKNWKPKGYVNTSFDTKGKVVEIGDVNSDGFVDYIAISKDKVEQFVSKTSGKYNIIYKKTKTIKFSSKIDNNEFGEVFADINNDGAKEFVLTAYNNNNYQVFKLYDGKTLDYLYTFCEKGVSGYESFGVCEADTNNDGYNEVIHYSDSLGCYELLNGKTGEHLAYFNTWQQSDETYGIDDYYHPDYIVYFMCDENYYIHGFADVNGDGYREVGVMKNYYDEETYESKEGIVVYDGVTFEKIKFIELTGNYGFNLIPVTGSDKHMVVSDGQSFGVLDLEKGVVIASFDLGSSEFKRIDDDTILASDGDSIYLLNIAPGFTLTSDVTKLVDGHKVDLAWDTDEEYSIMTISDNGTTVASTSENTYQLKLTAGKHTVTLSLDDGLGKSSNVSFDVEVPAQSSGLQYLVAFAVLMIAVALYFNLSRKIYIKKRGKEELR